MLAPALAVVGVVIKIVPKSEFATVDLYGKNGDLLLPVYTADGGKLGGFCSNEWKRRVIMRWCRAQASEKRVVTFACDTGNKYLSKLFNDFWMEDQGFFQRERHGNLRDLIGRPVRSEYSATSLSASARS